MEDQTSLTSQLGAADSLKALDYMKELCDRAENQQKLEKKRLRTSRITMMLCACMLIVLFTAVFALALPLARVTQEAQSTLEKINKVDLEAFSSSADGFLTQAGTSLDSVSGALKQLESLDIESMNSAIATLTTVVEGLSDLDIAMLNEAIKNLNDTVTPLANFFKKF